MSYGTKSFQEHRATSPTSQHSCLSSGSAGETAVDSSPFSCQSKASNGTQEVTYWSREWCPTLSLCCCCRLGPRRWLAPPGLSHPAHPPTDASSGPCPSPTQLPAVPWCHAGQDRPLVDTYSCAFHGLALPPCHPGMSCMKEPVLSSVPMAIPHLSFNLHGCH